MNRHNHIFELPTEATDVTVRLERKPDTADLDRLATLDSSEPPAGPVLLAEMDGRAVAALALGEGGRTVADPFVRTSAAVQILELRAAQLGVPTSPGSMRARRLKRLARVS